MQNLVNENSVSVDLLLYNHLGDDFQSFKYNNEIVLDAYHELYRFDGLREGTTNLNETLSLQLQAREHLCLNFLVETHHQGLGAPSKTETWDKRKDPSVMSFQESRNEQACKNVPSGSESLIIMNGGARFAFRTPYKNFKNS